MSEFRIVSLIPSATEMVAALGLESALVGRSHECDYPAGVKDLPICTEPKFDPVGDSGTIHQRVTDLLQSALSVYRVDIEQLRSLQPTHILTQAQCEVCAVSLGDVEQAVADLGPTKPQLISLQPNTLAEVWADLDHVATALQLDSQPCLTALRDRLHRCQQAAARSPKHPTVLCIEWTDPLMSAGNWVPELVTLVGGTALCAETGKHSAWLTWAQICQADPDVIIAMPCGYDLAQTIETTQAIARHQPAWSQLKAVQQAEVYAVDGNAFFNRPGPRLVESAEILAEILQPQHCNFGWQGQAWQRMPVPS
ncbi:MAG: cobalamin-binding protein [Cyanobacteria bacterium P01_H01_bin.121]